MMLCHEPLCSTTHSQVGTRDALGRLRFRCIRLGVASVSENVAPEVAAPTRAITQTPGARCMAPGVGDPLVLRTAHLWRVPLSLPTPADDGPVPRSVRSIPLTPTGGPHAAR